MTGSRPGRFVALLIVGALAGACSSSSSSSGDGLWHPGQPLKLDVSSVFAPGSVVRDAYTSATATVGADGTVTLTPGDGAVVLLERDGAAATPFRWKNATVYFLVTDRFQNGDPSNDASYLRQRDGADEVGTWHGGDFAGVSSRLDYIQGLGATAIWISPVVEQVHGWVAGGTVGDFKHYGYHGYWALDFTKLDASFGTPAELQALVDGAHQRGMRVLLDVVLNHPGYATGADLLSYLPEVFNDGTGDAFRAFDASTPGPPRYYLAWNDLVNYQSASWASWWSGSWVRAGLGGGYPPGGTTDETRSLAYLPDFRTESTATVALPPLLSTAPHAKTDTLATAQPGFTVRDYLVKWHSDWVRQLGVDGFRCDTVKNVEIASWKALKDAATLALADWKAANPSKKLDDAPFWMTGEVFGHGVSKDAYYTGGGFDSLINFTFQPALANMLEASGSLAAAAPSLESLYSTAAAALAPDPGFDALSYLSSHDTELFFEAVRRDPAKMRQAGTALLLAPGGVQVFYGDESGRVSGPSASDQVQGTRSDMNWSTTDASILAHWQKLGVFRKRHAAVGGGTHAKIASPAGTYAFSRKLADGAVSDTVVVAILPLQ